MFLVSDVILILNILLAVIIGILQVCQKKKWKERGSIWELLTWLTIVLFPLTVIPESLKQHNIELWWFFPIFGIFIGVWVAIGLIYRKSITKYLEEYDRFLAIFPIYFLVVGMIIFWLVQATNIIK